MDTPDIEHVFYVQVEMRGKLEWIKVSAPTKTRAMEIAQTYDDVTRTIQAQHIADFEGWFDNHSPEKTKP